MSKLRDSSINLGAMPSPVISQAHPRPAAPKADTPRDGGGMSTGKTSGNFSMGGMTGIPNNATPTGTQSGADASIAAQEANGK